MSLARPALGGAIVAALLMGTPGEMRAQPAAAAARPAFHAPLSWVIRTWRDTRPGEPAPASGQTLARRLDRVAQVAAAVGRADVARALDLSARYVATADTAPRVQVGHRVGTVGGEDRGRIPQPTPV